MRLLLQVIPRKVPNNSSYKKLWIEDEILLLYLQCASVGTMLCIPNQDSNLWLAIPMLWASWSTQAAWWQEHGQLIKDTLNY